MLYFFNTRRPRRLWLSITYAYSDQLVPVTTVVVFNHDNISNLLGTIESTCINKVYRMRTLGRYHVFVVKFKNLLRCSSASIDSFAGVEQTTETIDYKSAVEILIDELDTSQLGWTFFSLGVSTIKSSCKLSMLPPSPLEHERISALANALSSKGYDIKIPFVYTGGLCEFTGGGHLY